MQERFSILHEYKVSFQYVLECIGLWGNDVILRVKIRWIYSVNLLYDFSNLLLQLFFKYTNTNINNSSHKFNSSVAHYPMESSIVLL